MEAYAGSPWNLPGLMMTEGLPLKMPDDYDEEVLIEGWLSKRGYWNRVTWKQRWCVVKKSSLTYYADQACAEKKGSVEFISGVSTVSYHQNPKNPGLFVIDTDPANGPVRRFYHFDA